MLRIYCILSRISRSFEGKGFVKGILSRAADTKIDLRGRGYCKGCIVSCRRYQEWFEGEGGIVKGVSYRVADTKDVQRGGGIVKDKMYRVMDTTGVLGGGGFVKGISYRVVDAKGGLWGRAYC